MTTPRERSGTGLQIWVDADACPFPVKEVLFRTAERRQILVIVVANTSVSIPTSAHVQSLLAPAGMNMADREIIARVRSGDLVITADIPLAAAVIERGATVINPRGEQYNESNIAEHLGMRNLCDTLRGAGQIMGGPTPYGPKHRQAFCNQLDRWITQSQRRPPNQETP